MKSRMFSWARRLRVAPPSAPTSAIEELAPGPAAFRDGEDLPYGMRIAASWAWRFLVVVLAVGVVIWLLSKISLLLIPLMVAALLTGLLGPVVEFMHGRLAVPRGLAVGITVIGFLAVITAGLTMVGQRLSTGFSALWNQAVIGIYQVQDWLFNGPLQLSNDDLANVVNDALLQLRSNASNILSEALSWGSVLGQILTGILLAIFALIFLLLDGRKIGTFMINLLPRRARPAMDGAATRGWNSMIRYVRVQVLVAFIDAVGIGFGAFFLGVPLALPLGVLVFLARSSRFSARCSPARRGAAGLGGQRLGERADHAGRGAGGAAGRVQHSAAADHGQGREPAPAGRGDGRGRRHHGGADPRGAVRGAADGGAELDGQVHRPPVVGTRPVRDRTLRAAATRAPADGTRT